MLRRSYLGFVALLLAGLPVQATAQSAAPLDLSQGRVFLATDEPVVETAGRVLIEEIEKRTGIALPAGGDTPGQPDIHLRVQAEDAAEPLAPEGFRLAFDEDEDTLTITGADPRGVLFGVGHLLRKMSWQEGSVTLPQDALIASAPQYPLRGHQLGYRARANTYDAWDVAQYEQYIRELAIFGSNAVENIPTEGGEDSDVMPISRDEMNAAMSEICREYGLEFWMWIPATFNLTDPELRAAGLEEHWEIYSTTPHVSDIFFPGGDPGENHPRDVMPYLADVAEILHEYHPDAMIWLSMQGYRGERVDYVYDWIHQNDPRDWLAGLVHGPGSPALPETRERLPEHYKIRHYPDITHTVRSQYPLNYWDPAYARTHTREPVQVQPEHESYIHNTFAQYTSGFLAYSDGSHDNADKMIWSQLGWDTGTSVDTILTDYARFFLSAENPSELADGLAAFERNWEGPLATNGSVSMVAEFWRSQAHKRLDWRMDMFVMRAYLDEYTRQRLLHETVLEAEANAAVLAHLEEGPEAAIEAALAILARQDDPPARIANLREELLRLGEELWQSIGFQTSVPMYGALVGHRGAVLDYIDVPLNDRWWLEDEFEKVRAMEDEEAQIAHLRKVATWEDPGPGGFYDDIGHIGKSPRVVYAGGLSAHPTFHRNPGPTQWAHSGGFGRGRQAWHATIGFPHALQYEGLDSRRSYTLRLVGMGDAKPLADGEPLTASRYGTGEADIKEFPIPAELTEDREVLITFEPLVEDVNWREQSRIAEAWLLMDE